MCRVLSLVKEDLSPWHSAYGSPPTAASAHCTMPRLPKSSMCWSSYPISRKRGLVGLADLGGGAVESRRQENSTKPPYRRYVPDRRMLHLNAQSIRFGVGMVRIKLSLQSFVGPDTADVRLDEHLFPLGSAAPAMRCPNLVLSAAHGLSRLGVEKRDRPGGRPLQVAEGLPLVLNRRPGTTLPGSGRDGTGHAGHGSRRRASQREGVGVVVILIGLVQDIGVEHGVWTAALPVRSRARRPR